MSITTMKMGHRKLGLRILAVAALFVFTVSTRAATIYDADFSGSEGVTHTTGSPPPAGPHSVAGPNWTLSYQTTPTTDGSTNFARAAGDRFEAEDFGNTVARMISSAIDVSMFNEVDIEWDGVTVGSDVFNNPPTEFFEWFYALDAGTPVTQLTTSDGSLDLLLAGVDVSSASSLEVGFRWNADGATDGFDIFSMNVSGETSPEIPEPGSLTLVLLGSVGLLGVRRFWR